MRLKNILMTGLVLLIAGGLIGCSKDDDDENKEPEKVVVKGATKQVMVVFASGQLGDKGYADRVMDGIDLIQDEQNKLEVPVVDINFISKTDPIFTRNSLDQWIASARNPFTGQDYEERLLVLTEPYMLEWLDESNFELRDSDEVLVLKAVQEDLDKAEGLGLGNRLHALNISAARSARKFSEYMDSRIAYEQERGRGDDINANAINMLRLYDEEDVAYRDSIRETLLELRGENLELFDYPLSAIDYYGTYSPLLNENIIQAAYDSGILLNERFSLAGIIFTLVDLGTANLSFDYYLMRQPSYSFATLMLDAQPSSQRRFVIDRRFDVAVNVWVDKWLETTFGGMPQTMSFRDENYCQDNITVEM